MLSHQAWNQTGVYLKKKKKKTNPNKKLYKWKKKTFSQILDKLATRETGRWLILSWRLSLLNKGIIFAILHSLGYWPGEKDIDKMSSMVYP